MTWYLVTFNENGSSAGTVVRAEQMAREGDSVSLTRDGKTVFIAPAAWVADVESHATQQDANRALKDLQAARNRYRSARSVSEEHVVIRPPRAGETSWASGGLIESNGLTLKMKDLAHTSETPPAVETTAEQAGSAPPAPTEEAVQGDISSAALPEQEG